MCESRCLCSSFVSRFWLFGAMHFRCYTYSTIMHAKYYFALMLCPHDKIENTSRDVDANCITIKKNITETKTFSFSKYIWSVQVNVIYVGEASKAASDSIKAFYT